MQKHDINSPALRDPKREWYCAEEVEEAMQALKKANEWRTDWENVGKDDVIAVKYGTFDHAIVSGDNEEALEDYSNILSAKFKLL